MSSKSEYKRKNVIRRLCQFDCAVTEIGACFNDHLALTDRQTVIAIRVVVALSVLLTVDVINTEMRWSFTDMTQNVF